MKEITIELINKLHTAHAGLKKVYWNEIFDNENELINAMFNEKIKVENCYYYELCKGYEYIKGFRNYYLKHNFLTEKQIKVLKRLSIEIAFNIYCK